MACCITRITCCVVVNLLQSDNNTVGISEAAVEQIKMLSLDSEYIFMQDAHRCPSMRSKIHWHMIMWCGWNRNQIVRYRGSLWFMCSIMLICSLHFGWMINSWRFKNWNTDGSEYVFTLRSCHLQKRIQPNTLPSGIQMIVSHSCAAPDYFQLQQFSACW